MKRLFCVLALSGPSSAWAITCSIDGLTGVSFGAYDVFDPAPLDTAGDLTVTCSDVDPADNVTVSLSAGESGPYARRELSSAAGDTLVYDLYLDAAHTAPWGDGTHGTSWYGPINPASGVPFVVHAYGRMPARQDVAAGAYGDTIVVTVAY
jgi:spore coat protein U-like protein